MNKPILLLIIAFLLCGGAWATGKPQGMANVSLGETPAAATNLPEILKEPFLDDDDGVYNLMSLAWNQKIREALDTVHSALKYVSAKWQGLVDYFEENMETMRELHRRREEFLLVALRVKERRNRKVRDTAPWQPTAHIKPLSERLMTKQTLLSNLANYINSTNGKPYAVPKKIIAAMM